MELEYLLEQLNKTHQEFGNVRVLIEANLEENQLIKDWERFDITEVELPSDYPSNAKTKTNKVILYISK